MITTVLVLLASALLTILAVVGKTRPDSSDFVAWPTPVGWATIAIATAILALSMAGARENERTTSEMRSNLSRSTMENFLLLASMERSPRKIILDLPVRTDYLSRARDVRDVIYPGWKKETSRRLMGMFNVESASNHFFASTMFFVGQDRVLPTTDYYNRIAESLFAPQDIQSCGVRRIWRFMPTRIRQGLMSWRSRNPEAAFGDLAAMNGGERRLEEALKAASEQRELFVESCFGGLPVRWSGSSDVGSMPFQEVTRLNRQVIRSALGIAEDLGDPFCTGFVRVQGGAEEHPTAFDRFVQRGIGPAAAVEGFAPSLGVEGGCSRREQQRSWSSSVMPYWRDLHQTLRFEFAFQGEHSLADWLGDFEVGKVLLRLEYYNRGQTALSSDTIAESWDESFVEEPATAYLRVNRSGSVSFVTGLIAEVHR